MPAHRTPPPPSQNCAPLCGLTEAAATVSAEVQAASKKVAASGSNMVKAAETTFTRVANTTPKKKIRWNCYESI